MDKLYTKTTWVNDSRPALNADNLNNIENGIDAIDSRLVTVGNSVATLNNGLSDLKKDTFVKVTDGTVYSGYAESTDVGIVMSDGIRSVWFKCGKNATIKVANTNSSARKPMIAFLDVAPTQGASCYGITDNASVNSGEHEYCTVFYWYTNDSVSKEVAYSTLVIENSKIGDYVTSLNESLSDLKNDLTDYSSFVNLGYREDANVTSSQLSKYKAIGNAIPYIFIYYKNGLSLIIGYHYANAEYGSQLKLTFGSDSFQSRTLNDGNWSTQW